VTIIQGISWGSSGSDEQRGLARLLADDPDAMAFFDDQISSHNKK
jgi:hypothetical protein